MQAFSGDTDKDTPPPMVPHQVDDFRAGLSSINVVHDIALMAHFSGGKIDTSASLELGLGRPICAG